MDDDAAAPTRLVLDNWAWALSVARRKALLTYQLDADEAEVAATIALVEAARRYRPDSRASFRTFARTRINGAIIDLHRRQDTAGRWQRAHLNRGTTTKLLARGWEPPTRHGGDISGMADLLPAPAGPSQEDLMLIAEIYAHVRELPRPYCNILERHHFRGETLASIGASMGVTESRVCQLARVGVTLLRLTLKDAAP